MVSVDDGVVRRFAEHQCQCPGGRRWQHVSPKYARRARRFVVFLQGAGVAPPPLKAAPEFPLLDDYQHWLRLHRGLAERTVSRHLRILNKLLPELGTATHDYDAARIRFVVRKWRGQTGPAGLRTITSAPCEAIFAFSPARACAVPTLITPFRRVTGHVMSSFVVAAVSGEEIGGGTCHCILRSACPGRACGDRAILLLLAAPGGAGRGCRWSQTGRHHRLERRYPEVEVARRRRQVRLPLPQDERCAPLAYIEQERPRMPQDAVFLMMVPLPAHLSNHAKRLGHCGAGIKARRHFRSAIERSELAAPLRGNFDAAGRGPHWKLSARFCATARLI